MRRSHVELRSYDLTPPTQFVSETHSHKPDAPKKPIKEVNAMTAKLAELRGKIKIKAT